MSIIRSLRQIEKLATPHKLKQEFGHGLVELLFINIPIRESLTPINDIIIGLKKNLALSSVTLVYAKVWLPACLTN